MKDASGEWPADCNMVCEESCERCEECFEEESKHVNPGGIGEAFECKSGNPDLYYCSQCKVCAQCVQKKDASGEWPADCLLCEGLCEPCGECFEEEANVDEAFECKSGNAELNWCKDCERCVPCFRHGWTDGCDGCGACEPCGECFEAPDSQDSSDSTDSFG